jgi:UDP-glucose 4-epimerase
MTIPIPELHPQNPINPYGFSKLIVERILTNLTVSRCAISMRQAQTLTERLEKNGVLRGV